jgi:hypothetical protein
MYTDSRKLHIIEAVLKTDNEAILNEIETIVDRSNAVHTKTKARFSDLLGSLTIEEADSMKKTIEENFEKKNPNDWK